MPIIFCCIAVSSGCLADMRGLIGLQLVIVALIVTGQLVQPAAGDRPRHSEQQDEDFIGWSGESFNAQETFGDKKAWVEQLSWQPRAFLYHNFITEEEADHLVALAKPHVVKSEVVDSSTGEFVKSIQRTSSGYFLKRGQDEVVTRLEQRIADWTHLPVENGEPFHVLHYQAGEEYQEHYDYFFDTVNVKNGGQRIATALVYLSDIDDGGETVFPDSVQKPSAEEAQQYSVCGQAGLAVKPRKGDCLLFWNLQPDGSTKDTHSLHAGCPVCPNGKKSSDMRCDKWSATKWIRIHEHQVYQ